jgi:hypothetical protein
MRYGLWFRSLGLAIAFAALVVLGGCNRTNTAAPKTNTAASDPDQVLKNQTADVEQKTNAELNDWDRRIDQLKKERRHVKSRALKDQWKNAVADLEKKRDTVKDRLSDVKSAGADQWQTADNNLNAAEADLKNTYDDVVAKLGNTVTPHLQPEGSM